MKTAFTSRSQARRHCWAVLLRVLMAVLGGYVLTALACSVLAQVLVAVGAMQRAPAVQLSTLISFVLYTAMALWVFHVHSLSRALARMAVSAVLLGGALLALEGMA
ncbi:hypothetical protein [uncultured Comamonas sp.]|uniref:hypothetical protein n=1 Tax=uncultured Comamonas sp. TaxID=114710 RepID=UPI0025D180E8|nr:hypothetical protein [uncultured Comamonas sp.]